MSVLYVVLPLALLMAGAAVCAFIWAVRGGQFDDLDTPALRAVVDDDDRPEGADPPHGVGGVGPCSS